MKRFGILVLSLLCGIGVSESAGKMAMKLWYDKPATYFEESLPIGNGKLGALIYGGSDLNVIYLNDITLWTGKPVDRNADEDAHEWIGPIREALFSEDYYKADKLQAHVQGKNSEYYQPLLTLEIEDGNEGETSEYYRELDLDSALCRDIYIKGGTRFSREYFASNPDKVIAMKLKSDKKGAINCRIALKAQIPCAIKSAEGQLTATGHAMGEELNSIHFCSILKVKTDQGTVGSEGDSALNIKGASEAIIYFVNETSFNGADKHPVEEGAPYIENATDDAWHLVNFSYEELRKRHIADYKGIYDRFSLTLGTPKEDLDRPTDQQLKDYTDQGGGNTYLEMLYTQYGRYLLISCSRTKSAPANLQGLWTPHLKSPWRGNYTMNINIEENYWPAEVANMAEMTEPLEGFIKSLSENGTFTAKNYYGVDRGWCAGHNSDIWAMTNPVGEKTNNPRYYNWNMGGAWLVNALWEHYLFGQDTEWLAQTAYPLMKGAAEFCLGWLVENPNKEGELFTAPCTSPENTYKLPDGTKGQSLYGGTADLAIIRELLTNTLKAAQVLGEDESLQKEIEETIGKLSPYKIGKLGNLQEWYHDWEDADYKHRHQSHLIGLYPGTHISYDQKDLMAACEKSLELKGDMTTGWSTGWRINLWARLRKGKDAYHLFQKLLTYVSPDKYDGEDKRKSGGTYPNLFDAHPPFQIDGNFGGTAGVCEMILQSDDQGITLLPAIPDEWADGEISGIRARGGYEISMAWKSGKVIFLSIKAVKSGKLTIRNGEETIETQVEAGKDNLIISR